MTIGIAVSGPQAGLAAFSALAAAERIGRGAIGGFVSFAVMTGDGAVLRAETQRGGSATLFTDGETTGVRPSGVFADAPLAVLMSSGPDRPSPLSQFTPGEDSLGLVTGHRLPNTPLPDGRPINRWLLDALRDGVAPADAVAAFCERWPQADAGVIVLAADGGLALGNTARVERRDDVGSALIDHRALGIKVAVLHNAIFPCAPIATVAASVAVDAVFPADRWDFEIEVASGLPLSPGSANRIHVSADRIVERIEVDRPEWLGARWDGAALERGAAVCRDGTPVGAIVSEPYCVAIEGRLVSMSGRDHVRVGVRTIGGGGR